MPASAAHAPGDPLSRTPGCPARRLGRGRREARRGRSPRARFPGKRTASERAGAGRKRQRGPRARGRPLLFTHCARSSPLLTSGRHARPRRRRQDHHPVQAAHRRDPVDGAHDRCVKRKEKGKSRLERCPLFLSPLSRHAPLSSSLGFNVEKVQYKNVLFTVWDVGGQVRMRKGGNGERERASLLSPARARARAWFSSLLSLSLSLFHPF